MTGIRRSATLTAIALGGLVAVVVLEQALRGAASVPPIMFATAYLGMWVAWCGRHAAASLVLAIPTLTLVAPVAGVTLPAAIAIGVGTAMGAAVIGAILRPLDVRVVKPWDPVAIALAGTFAGLWPGLGAVVAAGDQPGRLGQVWVATALGAVLLAPPVLAFKARRGRAGIIRHPWEFAVLVVATSAAVAGLVALDVGAAAPGFGAWLLLPFLLVIGRRYGVLAASCTTLLGGSVATGVSALASSGATTPGLLLQRQIVCMLLVTVALTILLLLRDQRAILARERASAEVLSAFLGHADSMWYLKALAPEGEPLTYLRLGGGPFRDRDHAAPVTDAELFRPDEAAILQAADHEVLRTGASTAVVEHLTTPDGSTWTTLSNRFPVRDPYGKVIALGGIRTDITERESMARMQEQQTHLLEAVFVRSPVPSLRAYADPGGPVRVAAVNDALGHVIGRQPAEVVGRELRSLVKEEDWLALQQLLVATPVSAPAERWSPQAEVRVHTRIGQHRRALVTVTALDATSGHEHEYLIHVEDVTARRAAEEAVAWYSLFDSVTGLLNRTALSDRLDAALHRLGDDSAGVALITLDVDDFKSVNDSHGHGAGDLMLVEYGSRIQRVCESRDSVARLSADEFAILMEWDAQESVAVFVGRLQSVLAEPVMIGASPVSCTASFGVALTRDPEISAGELVRQSELALFRAKRQGRGRVEFYAESMRAQAQAVLNVRNEVTRAVAQDGFAVAYQPIVLLQDGSVTGFEALVRLPTQDGRLLSPAEFLDVARSAELVTQIDRLVLREALADLAGQRLAAADCGLSVNVESDDLRDPDFAIGVLAQLHAFSVAPAQLTIEVTEVALLPFDETVLSNMRSLRDAGVRFAIDDFGTGYSSLSQLRRLEVDIIKIDRAFVTAMEHDPEDANIVATVIGLAHRLGLVAVAEGIETRDQAETLQRLGCDRGQGYLFGHPLPIAPPGRASGGTSQAGTEATPGIRNR